MSTYLDIKSSDMKFNEFNGDLLVSENVEAILGSVYNIVLDDRRQRFFDEPFNPHPKYLLFDPIDFITASIIEERVSEVITKYEPRVKVNSVTATPNEDNQTYEIEVSIFIIPLERTETFKTILQRVK